MARSPLRPGAATPYGSTLSMFRYGGGDLTTRLSYGDFWRATLTPDGPGTLHLDWSTGSLQAHAWGDGADWLLASVPALTGALDPGHQFVDAHPAIMRAQHLHPFLRIGASGSLYHELLPTVLGQRVTGGEAAQQWRSLVQRLGGPAPGPDLGLRLPPDPADLASRPGWWFHTFGVEDHRADTLRTVARHASRLFTWSTLPAPQADAALSLLRGVGQWTRGVALGAAFGDPDAIAVGDFHLKNVVTHALTGRPRGSDDQMLELLAPYAGQRGRVVRLLMLDGHRAPKFGPRQRVRPLTRG